MIKLTLTIASLLITTSAYAQNLNSLQVTCNSDDIHASLSVTEKVEDNYYKDLRTTGRVLFVKAGALAWPSLAPQTTFKIKGNLTESDFLITGQYLDHGNGYAEPAMVHFKIERQNGGPVIFGNSFNYGQIAKQQPRPFGVFDSRECKVQVK